MAAVMNWTLWAMMPGLLLLATDARACRVASEWHSPSIYPSDAIVEAVVTVAPDSMGNERYADVRIMHEWIGHSHLSTLRLHWFIGGGACGPHGPIPAKDARLMIYLVKKDGGWVAQGWLPVTAPPDIRAMKAANRAARKRVEKLTRP